MGGQQLVFFSPHKLANPDEDALVMCDCEPICNLVMLF